MIAKMKFVNITGPKGDIDRVTRKYPVSYTHLGVCPLINVF